MGLSDHGDYGKREPREKGRRRVVGLKWWAAAALAGLAVVGAGCGGRGGPAVAGPGPSMGKGASTSRFSSSGAMSQALAYVRCMRSHGVPDFPDPTPGPGGGFAFQINGGPGSDLDRNDPRREAADAACRSLLPGGEQALAPSARKLAAELKWAQCLRSHGLPGFPDPNAQGAFDSSRFDDSSPAFRAASKLCAALVPTGPVSAVPGHGPP